MAALRGIGGIVIYATDAAELAEWYATHLGMVGLVRESSGGLTRDFYHREEEDPRLRRRLVWRVVPASSSGSAPQAALGVSYLVENLDEMVHALRAKGIAVGPVDEHADGRFARLRDPEGHAVILWED